MQTGCHRCLIYILEICPAPSYKDTLAQETDSTINSKVRAELKLTFQIFIYLSTFLIKMMSQFLDLATRNRKISKYVLYFVILHQNPWKFFYDCLKYSIPYLSICLSFFNSFYLVSSSIFWKLASRSQIKSQVFIFIKKLAQ